MLSIGHPLVTASWHVCFDFLICAQQAQQMQPNQPFLSIFLYGSLFFNIYIYILGGIWWNE